MKINRSGIVLASLLACLSTGCNNSSTTAAPVTGSVNVSLTDGAGSDYDHVWVTVKSIAFNTDPNQIWDGSGAGWQTTTLPAPVTLDLASLSNGTLDNVFTNMNFPVGGYRQIRLFLAGFDDALTASALTAGLTYNDQVVYTDATSIVHTVPLEIASPTQGLQLNGSFDVAASPVTLNLALDFDLEHDLVRFKQGPDYHFTLKPNLRYFDLGQSGAITGTVDPALLCTPATGVQTTCGYNVIVKAEINDGARHRDIRSTTIDPVTGNFALYPLPVLSAGQTYDVLIRGRNIETTLVKGVPAPMVGTPTSVATAISSGTIPMTIDGTGEYFANFNAALNPKSGYALFQQTLTAASGVIEVPYEVRWGNTNPFTGIPELPVALANGPLHVASYNAGGALSFSPVTPQEGSGGYTVVTNGLPLAYYNPSSSILVASSGVAYTATTPLVFTPPMPTPSTSLVQPGTASGTITQTSPITYDSGYLVVTRFANIVGTVNISTQLAGGSYSVTLPAGGLPITGTTALTNVPGAYYYAYLRVWNSAHPITTLKVVPVTGFIDLRNTNSVTGINVTLP